jgi:hypothetical protein
MLKRAAQRGRNRSGPRADFGGRTIRVVPHHHASRVARQALRRFRGNVRAVLEHRLARRIAIGEHRRVDIDDDLVAFSRRTGIELEVKRRFSNEHQRVGQLLGPGRRIGDDTALHVEIDDRFCGSVGASPPVEACRRGILGDRTRQPRGHFEMCQEQTSRYTPTDIFDTVAPAAVAPSSLSRTAAAVIPARFPDRLSVVQS